MCSVELSLVLVEAKMSHNLPSASWRPKKASGGVAVQSPGQEPGEAMVYV